VLNRSSAERKPAAGVLGALDLETGAILWTLDSTVEAWLPGEAMSLSDVQYLAPKDLDGDILVLSTARKAKPPPSIREEVSAMVIERLTFSPSSAGARGVNRAWHTRPTRAWQRHMNASNVPEIFFNSFSAAGWTPVEGGRIVAAGTFQGPLHVDATRVMQPVGYDCATPFVALFSAVDGTLDWMLGAGGNFENGLSSVTFSPASADVESVVLIGLSWRRPTFPL
jgi:hypothetical protein